MKSYRVDERLNTGGPPIGVGGRATAGDSKFAWDDTRTGAPFVAVSEGRDLYVFAPDGRCTRVHAGDTAGSHVGELRGHTATITCVWGRVYMGSADATLVR